MRIVKQLNIFFVIELVFVCISNISVAQWANDPSSNTKLVTDPINPINISAVKDLDGGAYIFWQDKKNNLNSNIYFLHIDQNGNANFRSDGKAITTNNNIKENPIAVSDPNGNSKVVWEEVDKKKGSNLFIQNVTNNGLRLWGANGLQLTDSKSEKIDYSLKTDNKGFSFVSYVYKTSQSNNKYSIGFKKIDPNGRVINDSSKGMVYNTSNILSETDIIPDNKGGSFILWLENINQKTMLCMQFIDSVGLTKWGNKPLTISKAKSSVISYSVGTMGKSVYAAITYQGTKKKIYQQLVSEKGKILWGSDGKPITYQVGSQINPKIVFIDSTAVVSWTNEYEKVKDVLIQRFDNNGKPLWGSNGKKIINITGNQFGQQLLYDGKGAIIIAWIDKKDNGSYANLSIQKIDLNGEFIWDPDGVTISSSQNIQKSYLNLVPDTEGGAIAVFRGITVGHNDIYGQKIFSTGTYASQILGLSSEVVDDSVKIFWYAANEEDGTNYSIQRSEQASETNEEWKTIGTLRLENKKQANYYEYYDVPDVSGSIFYRVVQNIKGNETQISPANKVDYFHNVESAVLAQNTPNPFSDSTTITFYLPKDENVTLEIFNSNVETIKKIDEQEYPAGKNNFIFSAQGLQPGVYYYRLKVSDFVDVKKMVITD
jgi:hypothetical protein